MANRIEEAFERVQKQIDAAVAAGKDLAQCEKAATLEMDEYVALQDAKSAAHAAGVLTLDEAQTIYGVLGETPDHFHAQPLNKRIVVIKLTTELKARV